MNKNYQFTIGILLFLCALYILNFYFLNGYDSLGKPSVMALNIQGKHIFENINEKPKPKSNFSELYNSSWMLASRTCTQIERKAHIRKMCAKYGDMASNTTSIYIFDSERNVAYCPIPKNGCSTWKDLIAKSTKSFKNITGYFDVHNDTHLAKLGLRVYGSKKIVNTSTKFVILRHPLSRFISAYNEKFNRTFDETQQNEKWFLKWMTARQKVLKQVGKFKGASYPYLVEFKDFVEFIVKKMWKPWLIEEIHWRIQENLCHLCSEK